MSRVVVISGHPNLEDSYTNSVIISQLVDGIEEIDIRRLDSLYPDFQVDVEVEQQALIAADVIVLQFPFYWYSVPALLKKWIDDTFSYNFAYGAEGDKLKGKDFILSFTIGGPEEAYTPTGYNHFPIEELIKPLEQTAYLAGMNFRTPVFTHRMVYIPGVYNSQEAVERRAKDHANRLIGQVEQLLHSPESKVEQFVIDWFQAFDLLPENTAYFLSHLSEDVVIQMPEGMFKGHSGFKDWYQQARSTFKPNCQHQVEQVEISTDGNAYQVDLRIRLIAHTYPESNFEGKLLNLLVNETWQVAFDDQGKLIINSYLVTPVFG